MHNLKNLLIIFWIVILSACVQKDDKSGAYVPPCFYSNQQVAPGWVCGEPYHGLALQAVGVAEKSVAGHNYMFDMANIAARKQLTELFKVDASRSVIQYLKSIHVDDSDAIKAGASVINAINVHTLAATQQYASEIEIDGRAYVLVGVDKKTYQALLEKLVKTSISNDHELWTQLQADKSFAEIATGIAVKIDRNEQ